MSPFILNNNNCKSEREIVDFINSNGIQISLHSEDLSINLQNYTFPIIHFLTVRSYLIDPDFNKIQNFFLQNVVLNTDNCVI